jgi:coenzyme F420-0:L-glutamate ligase/coenzyme F420-1:gamma-L-glutamate ligase
MRPQELRIVGIRGLPMVRPGDDLPRLLVEGMKKQGLAFHDGDVIVLSQKIVSKAQGRFFRLRDLLPSRRAVEIAKRTKKDPRFVQAVLNESSEVLRADGEALIVRTKNGITCLNAGLDRSNVEGQGTYSLLPFDPDAEALWIKKRIKLLTGRKVAVLICDTFSRPFRSGQVEFAIGLAGLNPIEDYRGKKDLFGHRLRFKFVSLADELACAAELVMGQGDEGIPAALIRGFNSKRLGSSNSKSLIVSRSIDLFRGTI